MEDARLEPFHVLNLVREHFIPYLTMPELVTLLLVNKESNALATHRLNKIRKKYKGFYHLSRIVHVPLCTFRYSWIRVTFKGQTSSTETVENTVTFTADNIVRCNTMNNRFQLNFVLDECERCFVNISSWCSRVFSQKKRTYIVYNNRIPYVFIA